MAMYITFNNAGKEDTKCVHVGQKINIRPALVKGVQADCDELEAICQNIQLSEVSVKRVQTFNLGDSMRIVEGWNNI